MSSKTSKRPTRAKQPWEKMHAITRVKNGESKAAVARSIDVPESTLRGWCKNSAKIEATTRQPSSSPASGASTEVSDTQANKRVKIDDNAQPQNLSVRNSTPGPSEINANYQSAIDLSRTSPQATSSGRAENGMMMNPTDFSKYYTAARFSQVFQALQQAQGMSLLAGNNGGSLLATATSPPSLINSAPVKLPNERIPPDESVRHWLNTSNPSQISPNSASATLSTPLNGQQTTSPIAGNTPEQQQTLYLEWYKAMISRVGLGAPFNMPLPSSNPNIPILYNQLMQNASERSAPLSYPATPRQPARNDTVSNQPQEEFDVPEMHCNDEAQKPGSPLSTGTCHDKNARSPSVTGKSASISEKSPSLGRKSPNIGGQSPVMSVQSTSGDSPSTSDESPSTSDESPITSDESPSTSVQSSADQILSVNPSPICAPAQECKTPKIQSPVRSEKSKKSKKSILENLVSDLKENVGNRDENREVSDIRETIAIGEKFLQCLENTSHPGVTAFHLKQIKSILTSVTAAVETTCKRKRKDE